MRTYHVTVRPIIELAFDVEAESKKEASDKAEDLAREAIRLGCYDFPGCEVEGEDDDCDDDDAEWSRKLPGHPSDDDCEDEDEEWDE
jgi:hypothetical protein